ncbi:MULTISPECIES: GAF and ANTAR domain-containing protein [Streptomyces]|uniref:GAF and ANTAR domain-containing protein n=1 Tax=Streptomyces TaxID=1883 RepID=UPI0013AD31DA|nr:MULTISPECIES: GAF and ANTAR domain-containing protein [Streptomyces]MYS48109.1 ANTAR domain-containing protein [Streptomyces sp. SID5998]MYX47548.1 ANTAR domain-containing protein [Streptomyces sp. SID89]NED72079.1 GAF and ANTAR domain-containing protein [Streptomyces sp. SID9944]MBY8869918.1 GAF and ANTAR domain-containing protein [Streptomyces sennicomposti]NED31449.1 GAF and ANTAR domain-containing protein [Streptomyces sp. SID8499]
MDWREFAEQMAQLARRLLAQDSPQATLEEIVSAAVELIDGCEAAGILAVRKGRAVSLAVSGDMVEESDRLQGELGEGPCFDAARRVDGDRMFRISDMTKPQPAWPRYAPAARDLGIGSMMGFLLYTEDEDFGALDCYSTRPGAFTPEDETAGWLLASHAAVAVASARTVDQLEHALETRHAIGEAMGILRERHRLSEDDAFAVLRRISQHHNVKLRDVAQNIREKRPEKP